MAPETRRRLWMMVILALLIIPAWAQIPDGPKSPPKGYKLVVAGSFDFAKDFSEGLAPVKVGGKWGFIDTTGKMVIEPQFNPKQAQFNSYFSDDLVAVNFNDGTVNGFDSNSPANTKWGFADKSGRIVINPNFDGDYFNPPHFSEGLAVIAAGVPGGAEMSFEIPGIKFGYLDKAGRFAIEPKFEKAFEFNDGVASVRINGKWGFIDKRGQFVIEPIYDQAYRFSEGLSPVTLNERTFFIDKSGKRVNDKDFPALSALSDGLASIIVTGKTGFVDRFGKVLIEPQFDSNSWVNMGADFSEGLCLIEFGNNGGTGIGDILSGKFGYINKTGAIVINPKFGFSSSFKNGIAKVEFNGKAGYIDKSGKFVIPPQFSEAGDFNDGVALVQFNQFGKYFFIKRMQPNVL